VALTRPRVVLAALSGGVDAGPVLAAAQRVGALLGLPVRALHVWTPGVPVPEHLADSGIPLYVGDGEVRARITAAAEAPDVAAVVLGTGASGKCGRSLGTTAREVATGTRRPVVFVPPGASTGVIERVLFPLEGTPETSLAARPWAERALAAGLEVTAVHVLPVPDPPAFTDQPQHEEPPRDDEFLRRHCAWGTGPVDLVTRVGNAEDVVPSVAWEYGADLVVLAWSRRLAPCRARLVQALLARSPARVTLITVPVEPSLLHEVAFPGGTHRLPTGG
jgi:nucleotide-binding universal stress UspA family protein